MTYKTILTSKGTTTIPKQIRDALGIKPGMLLSFSQNHLTGEYTLKRSQTISEIRKANKLALDLAKTSGKTYVNGAGYTAHINRKFGDT